MMAAIYMQHSVALLMMQKYGAGMAQRGRRLVGMGRMEAGTQATNQCDRSYLAVVISMLDLVMVQTMLRCGNGMAQRGRRLVGMVSIVAGEQGMNMSMP